MGGDLETLEGYGYNTGGAGGAQIVVTNLNDSGAGSLREACSASGARWITFSVSGNIELVSMIAISNPHITIDGSTAPNGGVCIKGFGLDIDTTDVIIRHLRVRPGANLAPSNNDGIYITSNAQRIMIDHCSLSWAQDENLSCYGQDITVQNCIISEGLSESGHPEGEHSRGAFSVGTATRISWHHNLFAHNIERNPTIGAGLADLINNVLYNGGMPAIATPQDSNVQINFIKNWQKSGVNTVEGNLPAEGSGTANIRMVPNAPNTLEIYPLGNIGPRRTDDGQAQNLIFYSGEDIYTVANRFAYTGTHPVTETSAIDAKAIVLANVGATLPERDAVDLRIVADVDAGTGSVINDPSDVGGWPDLTI